MTFVPNRRVARTALSLILPAAFALTAQAGVILTNNGGIVESGVTTTLSNPIVSFEQLPADPNLTGVKYYGGATMTTTASGAGSQAECWANCLTFLVGGTVGGGAFTSDSLLTSFNFTITDSNNSVLAWGVHTDIVLDSGVPNSPIELTASANGLTAAGGGTITGSETINGLLGKTAINGFVSNGVAVGSWRSFIHVDFSDGWTKGDTITLSIPQNSSDFTTTPTPEPASLAFIGVGAIAAGWLKRKRL